MSRLSGLSIPARPTAARSRIRGGIGRPLGLDKHVLAPVIANNPATPVRKMFQILIKIKLNSSSKLNWLVKNRGGLSLSGRSRRAKRIHGPATTFVLTLVLITLVLKRIRRVERYCITAAARGGSTRRIRMWRASSYASKRSRSLSWPDLRRQPEVVLAAKNTAHRLSASRARHIIDVLVPSKSAEDRLPEGCKRRGPPFLATPTLPSRGVTEACIVDVPLKSIADPLPSNEISFCQAIHRSSLLSAVPRCA